MAAIDLIAWAEVLLLDDGELAKAESKKLRYRLLHTGLPHRPRPAPRPFAHRRKTALGAQLAAAFVRLAAGPRPHTS